MRLSYSRMSLILCCDLHKFWSRVINCSSGNVIALATLELFEILDYVRFLW